MNYAKKLGQKMVKARQGKHTAPAGLRADFRSTRGKPQSHSIPGGVVPTKPVGEPPVDLSRGRGRGGGYRGPWRQVGSQGGGPAAPGSSMGFGKGYKQTYAESHVHGKPSTALRNYRRKKRGVTTTAT